MKSPSKKEDSTLVSSNHLQSPQNRKNNSVELRVVLERLFTFLEGDLSLSGHSGKIIHSVRLLRRCFDLILFSEPLLSSKTAARKWKEFCTARKHVSATLRTVRDFFSLISLVSLPDRAHWKIGVLTAELRLCCVSPVFLTF